MDPDPDPDPNPDPDPDPNPNLDPDPDPNPDPDPDPNPNLDPDPDPDPNPNLDPDPDPDPDLTIVLLGKSGVGKSASGNTILGRKVFESDFGFTSVTTEIHVETGRVFEKRISVVDTPGILDSKKTTEDIQIYCQDLLKSNKPCLFLVVLSIGRFTKEDQKAVTAALKVLGRLGSKKSYLLFTNGDRLQGRSLEDFIFTEKEGKLPDVVRMFSGASHHFNNEDGDQEQVRDLLLKTGYLRDHQPLDPAAGLKVQRKIVLLGLPGVGKSSSGNTILESEKFESGCDFNSVSTECVSESASVNGRLIQVVDTPGFTDEVLDPEQLYLQIMKTLVKASPGPHAFIIVVRLGRVSAADKKLLELLPKLFGEDASKYTMVLFTHGDELRGRSIDQLIQSNRYVSDLVSMCDGRYCVFDNTQNRKRLQVRELLNKIDEMVEANGGEHCTSDMFRMAETFIREEKNRADQSDGRNRPDQSGGTGGEPDNNPAWKRIIPYVIRFGVAGGLIGLIAAAAAAAGGGGTVAAAAAAAAAGGGGAVAAAAATAGGAMVGGIVGSVIGWFRGKSLCKSQSNKQSSRVAAHVERR